MYNMNIELTTTNLQKLCRICLKEGKLNLWQHKVQDGENDILPLHKIFRIFDGEMSNLDLGSEMPLLCEECLRELLHCQYFYSKLERGNKQMKKLYTEALQMEAELRSKLRLDLMPERETDYMHDNDMTLSFIEDQYYMEHQHDSKPFPEQDFIESPPSPQPSEPIDISDSQLSGVSNLTNPEPIVHNKQQRVQQAFNVQRDAKLVVTKFVSKPAIAEKDLANEAIVMANNNEFLTMDYAAVAVCADNLELVIDDLINEPIAPSGNSDDINNPIYLCKYCPQAFTIPQYLIAHVRKSHACKFCTKAFNKTSDLHDHLDQEHARHNCVICGKDLSSHTNLRSHIKRVHGLQLPAKMTLLDYKP